MTNAEWRMPNAVVRPERPLDVAGVFDVDRAAFGRDDEARLVDTLRATDAVIASLVAAHGDDIVGHVLFSAVSIESSDGSVPIASLAPLAVLPAWQRRGIGAALVRAGLEMCRSSEYPAVIVVGDPAYYARFGFAAATVAHLGSPYAGEACMGLDLRPGFLRAATGTIRYPPAFARLS